MAIPAISQQLKDAIQVINYLYLYLLAPRMIFQPCSYYAECGDYLSCHTFSGINRCYHYPRLGGEPCTQDLKAQCMIGLTCHEQYNICVQNE